MKKLESFKTNPCLSDNLWQLITNVGQQNKYEKGEFLYHQNTPSPGIFFVESGRIKVFQIMDNGTERLLRVVGVRAVFGEASTFDGYFTSPAAVALEKTIAWIITKEKAEELINTNGEFAMFIVQSLIHKLKTQSHQLGVISGKKVLSRLANVIYTLDYYGIPMDEEGFYLISQSELAEIVCTTRPNINVLINKLADMKAVEIRRNRIRIIDKSKLKNFSNIDE